MFKTITPQDLLDQLDNFYGIKAQLSDAEDYLMREKGWSLSAFIDWTKRRTKHSIDCL